MHLAKSTGVKAVRIGKAEADEVTVKEGWYPYARTLRLYSNMTSESPVARDFARFVQSKPDQEFISETGFVRRFEKRLSSHAPD